MHHVIPTLSVVVPAFNEASRFERTLPEVLQFLGRHRQCELIVVDDGSTDGTAAVAERQFGRGDSAIRARVIRFDVNRGKGCAVRTGLLAARAPIALFMDADLSTPLAETPKLVEPIVHGECDIALGSRAIDRTLIGVHQPWRREIGGRLLNGLLRVTTGLPIRDTQCGFKAFRMSVCRPLLEAARIDRFGFDLELLYVASRAGLRLAEIPVRWNHCDGSKVHVWRDGVRMVGEAAALRRHAATGTYDQAIREIGVMDWDGRQSWGRQPMAHSIE
jgi:dolichyl-phosphate beta-glucosyltransferase